MKFKFWLYAGNLLRPRYRTWMPRLLGLVNMLTAKLPSVMLFAECDKTQVNDINKALNNRYDYEVDTNGNAIMWLRSRWEIELLEGSRVVRKKNLPNKLNQDRTLIAVKLRRVDRTRSDSNNPYCWFAVSHFSSSAKFLKPADMSLSVYKEEVKKERIAQAKYCAEFLKDFKWLIFYVDQNSYTKTVGHPLSILKTVMADWRDTLPTCLNREVNSHHGYHVPIVSNMQDIDVIYHGSNVSFVLDDPNKLVGKVLTHENKISDHHHFRLLCVVNFENQKA